jgi:hypothetical protein
MPEKAWFSPKNEPTSKPLTSENISRTPEEAINSEGVNLSFPAANDDTNSSGDARLSNIDKLLAKENLMPERREQLENKKKSLLGEKSPFSETDNQTETACSTSPQEDKAMNPEELQALRQKIQNSRLRMPSADSSDNETNLNPDRGNFISTSKAEKPNPFHQPIPTPERDNYPRLKDDPGGINDWLSKKYEEENNKDGYRKYLKESQPNQDNQNIGNRDLGTNQENTQPNEQNATEANTENPQIQTQTQAFPDWRSRLDEFKNRSSGQQNQYSDLTNQNDDIKAKLQGDYGQKSDSPRIRETSNPGDFTPELKDTSGGDSYGNMSNSYGDCGNSSSSGDGGGNSGSNGGSGDSGI